MFKHQLFKIIFGNNNLLTGYQAANVRKITSLGY